MAPVSALYALAGFTAVITVAVICAAHGMRLYRALSDEDRSQQ
jgi:hypothetical protein